MGMGCRLHARTRGTFHSLVNHNVGTNGDGGRRMGEKE